uniref:Uncharacterized protein n=1 Tax=Desertifilum tharense IPPAS B-1220 TaxID=1781255 RepID=A0ACD5GNU7_9CYAN
MDLLNITTNNLGSGAIGSNNNELLDANVSLGGDGSLEADINLGVTGYSIVVTVYSMPIPT